MTISSGAQLIWSSHTVCCYLSLFAVVLRMNSRTFFQGSLSIPLKPVYQNKQRPSDTKMGFLETLDIPVIIKPFFKMLNWWLNDYLCRTEEYHAIELYSRVAFIDFLHRETDFDDNITFQNRPTMNVVKNVHQKKYIFLKKDPQHKLRSSCSIHKALWMA